MEAFRFGEVRVHVAPEDDYARLLHFRLWIIRNNVYTICAE